MRSHACIIVPMLLISGTFRLSEDNLPEARSAMQRMIEASREEDGCISYAYAQDILDPKLIRVHEIWRDKAALDHHFTTRHLADWRAAWAELGIVDRNLTVHAVGDGDAT